jgi:hypothetical protein
MMTEHLEAKVSWENGVVLSGTVSFSYMPKVDPWLVHATFCVSNVRDEYELERHELSGALSVGARAGEWWNVGNVRIGVAESFIRFRLSDPKTKTWADFDVSRQELTGFIGRTAGLCDYESEKTALAAYVDKALEEEMDGWP